jgi:hypothetical protein
VPPFFAGNGHWSRQSLLRVNGRSPERLIAAGSGTDFGSPFERLTPAGASLKTRSLPTFLHHSRLNDYNTKSYFFNHQLVGIIQPSPICLNPGLPSTARDADLAGAGQGSRGRPVYGPIASSCPLRRLTRTTYYYYLFNLIMINRFRLFTGDSFIKTTLKRYYVS